MAKAQQKKAKAGVGVFKILILWILMFPLVFLGYPTFILVAVGMVPTIVSLSVERETSMPATLCIGCFNVCGVVPYVLTLWEQHQSFKYMTNLFFDPYTLLVMYGTGGIGYSLYWGMPKIILGAMRLSARSNMRQLREAQRNLAEDWGDIIEPDKRSQANDG